MSLSALKPRRRGFMLIALLVGFLLPALGVSRAAAQPAVSKANLNPLGDEILGEDEGMWWTQSVQRTEAFRKLWMGE